MYNNAIKILVMKTTINYRYAVLAVLLGIAIIGIFSIPADGLSFSKWLVVMMLTKAIGFAAAFCFYKLLIFWDKSNIIPQLSKLINDEY